MANAMLATYPELFSAGAAIAGLPFGAANNLGQALQSMSSGSMRPAPEWGDHVRAASPNRGRWPRVSVWHGDADTTVRSVNAGETVKQWVNVHGLPAAATVREQLPGCTRQTW